MSKTNALHGNGIFSLQHIELFHHTEDGIAFLKGLILALLDQLDLPHPSLLPSHEGVLEV